VRILVSKESGTVLKRIIIESPYAGMIERNVRYARACMRDSLGRGEAPIASHLIYTQEGILDDQILSERENGIRAGFAWWDVAELIAFYTDLGWSDGMLAALDRVTQENRAHEIRSIHGGKTWPIGQ
jgi:hypothetical protein